MYTTKGHAMVWKSEWIRWLWCYARLLKLVACVHLLCSKQFQLFYLFELVGLKVSCNFENRVLANNSDKLCFWWKSAGNFQQALPTCTYLVYYDSCGSAHVHSSHVLPGQIWGTPVVTYIFPLKHKNRPTVIAWPKKMCGVLWLGLFDAAGVKIHGRFPTVLIMVHEKWLISKLCTHVCFSLLEL